MKMIAVVSLALVAIATALPVQEEPVPILRSEGHQEPDGTYEFSFETGDGTSRSENGEPKELLDENNKPHTVVVVRGSYQYPGEDGKPISITYQADQNGYQAFGETIPQNPSS